MSRGGRFRPLNVEPKDSFGTLRMSIETGHRSLHMKMSVGVPPTWQTACKFVLVRGRARLCKNRCKEIYIESVGARGKQHIDSAAGSNRFRNLRASLSCSVNPWKTKIRHESQKAQEFILYECFARKLSVGSRWSTNIRYHDLNLCIDQINRSLSARRRNASRNPAVTLFRNVESPDAVHLWSVTTDKRDQWFGFHCYRVDSSLRDCFSHHRLKHQNNWYDGTHFEGSETPVAFRIGQPRKGREKAQGKVNEDVFFIFVE